MPRERGINQDGWPRASCDSLGDRMACGAAGKHGVFMNMAALTGEGADDKDGEGIALCRTRDSLCTELEV